MDSTLPSAQRWTAWARDYPCTCMNSVLLWSMDEQLWPPEQISPACGLPSPHQLQCSVVLSLLPQQFLILSWTFPLNIKTNWCFFHLKTSNLNPHIPFQLTSLKGNSSKEFYPCCLQFLAFHELWHPQQPPLPDLSPSYTLKSPQ